MRCRRKRGKMEQKTVYRKQKRLARLLFFVSIPDVAAVAYFAIAARSLIEWLDLIDSAVLMLGVLIVFLLSRKMTKDLRYEYNYGTSKIEALTALLCETLEFGGLIIITLASVIKIVHPEQPSEMLIYAVALKVINLCFDAYFLIEQKKLTRLRETHITGSEYAAYLGMTLFDGAALLSLLVVWLIRDFPASCYISPVLSIIIAVYMTFVSVKHVRSAITDLLDKTLPEKDQMIILRVMAKHNGDYSELKSIKSHKSGSDVIIDISVSFPQETDFAEISRFRSEIQDELSQEIKNCRVSVIIGNENG